MPTLTIDTGGPARLTVRAEDGTWCVPEHAVRDRTAAERPGAMDLDLDATDRSGSVPGYTRHVVTDGVLEVPVPRGTCTVIAERGPEHHRVERRIDAGPGSTRVSAVPERWTDLAAEGWWSGDLHVHRPLADAGLLLRAEDLHLAAVVTRWTGQPAAEDVAGPPWAAATVDGDRHVVAPVTEDERGGGAWLLHGASVGDLPGTDARSWWYPAGRGLVDRARARGAWFDCEKLTWWETPVMMATGAPDSVGVLNNHFLPGGFVANEAWGRPRDRGRYPGAAGTSRYHLDLYYRYLRCGLRLPASAGSASGVLPAPPGYNRVYVQAPGPLTVAEFYDALRAGRSMVTNGPLLTCTVDGQGPGATVPAGPARVRASVRWTGPPGTVEVVADGRVVARADGPELDTTVDLSRCGWLAVRATVPDPVTVRLAHTSPVYVDRDAPPDPEDRAFFAHWIAELTEADRADRTRFTAPAHRDEVLDLYQRAARFYR